MFDVAGQPELAAQVRLRRGVGMGLAIPGLIASVVGVIVLLNGVGNRCLNDNEGPEDGSCTPRPFSPTVTGVGAGLAAGGLLLAGPGLYLRFGSLGSKWEARQRSAAEQYNAHRRDR